MLRDVVKIDEELCDGCSLCIPNCHEGALQMIDGKARLISDLMCDGLGACIGHCPQGAITIEKREAEPYNETEVMKIMIEKGENTVVAHLQHLKEHNETDFLKEGIQYLKTNQSELPFNFGDVMNRVHNADVEQEQLACGCPGSEARSFSPQSAIQSPRSASGSRLPSLDSTSGGQGHPLSVDRQPSSADRIQDLKVATNHQASELRQWPVQMHLINPMASYFQQADVVLAADCVAFSLGNFHSKWLSGKSLAIACPKLDTGLDSYVEKIISLMDDAKINTLTVMMMQVPCCGGLLQMVKAAQQKAERKVPIKAVIVGVEGEILQDEWI